MNLYCKGKHILDINQIWHLKKEKTEEKDAEKSKTFTNKFFVKYDYYEQSKLILFLFFLEEAS